MKETFDRSKFKGAKLSTLKETQEKANETNVKLLDNGEQNGRPGFHTMKDAGRYVFRIMPPKNSEDPTYQPFRSTMLECELPEYKDGKETGKMEVKKKRIFIATVHGNEETRKLKKDPIELYIKYVGELAALYDDKKDRQKFLNPVTGYQPLNQKWVPGIMPSTSYVCYALKDGKLGRLELYDKFIKEMDKITAKIEEEDDEVTGIDPFSNPDEGYPLVIEKKKAKDKDGKELNKWDYDIDRILPKKRQSWDDFCEEHRVTDEQLKELSEKESLKELYVDVYTKRDFELALNGLQLFDQKYKYGIFENDEFVKEIKEIEAVVPEPKKDDTSDIEEAFDKKKQSAKDWDDKKCKSYLRAYVMDEDNGLDVDAYLEAISQLNYKELHEWCILVEKGKKLPELETEDEQPDVEAPEGTEVEEGSSEEDELAKLTANRRRRS